MQPLGREHQFGIRGLLPTDSLAVKYGAQILLDDLLLALSAQGLASCWISSTLFCQQESRAALGMSEEWFALGTVAVGPMPAGAASPRPPLDLSEHLRTE